LKLVRDIQVLCHVSPGYGRHKHSPKLSVFNFTAATASDVVPHGRP